MARKVSARSSRAAKQRLQNEYKRAVAERRRLVSYLKAATGILTKDEMDLLSEFAQIAKRKCDRLRKAVQQRSTRHAA